ncbi:MAG TPA: hypothetical protein VHG51_16045 [Longimicrobiaceae bacterium]|nr:hypothetical protein [Longimicrobiaceae bacterium]
MAYREFTDREGRRWRAWDTYPMKASLTDPEYREGWLCFESEDAGKRRLAPVPRRWEHEPEDRLELLAKMADEVVPTHAPPDRDVGPPLPQPD